MSKYKLLQGDCLELMKKIPGESIDLILTDPPYNVSKKNNFRTMGRSGIDFGEWDHEADITSWIQAASHILKSSGSMVIFNAWRNLSKLADGCEANGLIVKDVIRWIKPNPMPRNRDRRYIVDYEFALWVVGKDKWTFNRQDSKYQRPKFEYPTPSGKNRVHPTQKPQALMEDLIKIHSNENDIVLDPFMGSGSTGVAAVKNNRKFIGMELDEKYFGAAKDRLQETELQETA